MFGVPKILELLTMEGYCAKANREIRHHEHPHKLVAPNSPAIEVEEHENDIGWIKRVVSAAPVGYRAPSGEMSSKLIRRLTERGFIYNSTSLDDIEPYRHILESQSRSSCRGTGASRSVSVDQHQAAPPPHGYQ